MADTLSERTRYDNERLMFGCKTPGVRGTPENMMLKWFIPHMIRRAPYERTIRRGFMSPLLVGRIDFILQQARKILGSQLVSAVDLVGSPRASLQLRTKEQSVANYSRVVALQLVDVERCESVDGLTIS